MYLIDTHTHLYVDAFDTDQKEVIERAMAVVDVTALCIKRQNILCNRVNISTRHRRIEKLRIVSDKPNIMHDNNVLTDTKCQLLVCVRLRRLSYEMSTNNG